MKKAAHGSRYRVTEAMLLPQRRIASGSQPDTRVADLKNPISPPYYLRAGFLWDRLLARVHNRVDMAANRAALSPEGSFACLFVKECGLDSTVTSALEDFDFRREWDGLVERKNRPGAFRVPEGREVGASRSGAVDVDQTATPVSKHMWLAVG